MATVHELTAESRDQAGRGASRLLRRNNRIPAILYGADKPPAMLSLNHFEISKAFQKESVFSHVLTLMIDGNPEKAVLKDIQRHPYKPKIVHIDFLRINPNEKISMQIPLHFKGQEEAPGIKEGGVFMHLMSSVEVRCLPAHLPEFIEVDVSNFNIDDALHLSQLNLPKDTELAAFTHGHAEEHDSLVVKLHIPRVVEEEPAPVAEEAVASEEAAPASDQASDAPEGK